MTKNRVLASKRQEQMLKLGTGPHEISRCLHETRTRLIAAKAKAGNLPKGREQEIQFVLGLPSKAMDVVRSWFRTNGQFDPQPATHAALAEAKLDISSTEEPAQAAWRAIFRAFVQDDCPEEVKAFLDGLEQDEPAPLVKLGACGTEITLEDAEECLRIAGGGPYEVQRLRIVPAAVAGIIAIAQGNHERAEACSSALAECSGDVAKTLAQVVAVLGKRHAGAGQTGVEIRRTKFQAILSGEDPHAHPFVGIVKRVLPSGQAFVRPAALAIGDGLIELTPEQANALFPSSGDATVFPGAVPEPCREGEIWLWRAEQKNTDKSAQYVVTEQLCKVYEVVQVPHSSGEPDKVREWLQHGSYKRKDDASPVFLLSDGVLLKIQGDPAKYNFDNPIAGYRNHHVFQFQSGRMLAASPFPAPEVKYDCAPAASWIRKLLRLHADAVNFPAYSKAQLHALVEFAKHGVDESTAQSLERARAKLHEVCATQELVQDLVKELMRAPEVAATLEEEKKGVLATYEASLAGRRTEIARLENKARELEQEQERQKRAAQAEIERKKKTARELELELDARIRSTFERATKDGIETLAHASLLRALVTDPAPPARPLAVPVGQGTASPLPDLSQPARRWAASGLELKGAVAIRRSIRERASRSGISENLLSSVMAAAMASSVIGLLGRRSRSVIAALADVVASGVACEVSVTGDMFGVADLMKAPALVRSAGQQWPTTLGEFLEKQQAAGDTSVVELRGANRAPLECFLPELLALRIDETPPAAVIWADRADAVRHCPVTKPIVFVLSFVEGRSTFPLQGLLAREVPIVQADSGWVDEAPADPGPPVEHSFASTSAWLSLASPVLDGEGTDGEVAAPGLTAQRMRLAAIRLGISPPNATAIAFVSLKAGRMPAVQILDQVEREAPELTAYASCLAGGDAGRMLAQVVVQEDQDGAT